MQIGVAFGGARVKERRRGDGQSDHPSLHLGCGGQLITREAPLRKPHNTAQQQFVFQVVETSNNVVLIIPETPSPSSKQQQPQPTDSQLSSRLGCVPDDRYSWNSQLGKGGAHSFLPLFFCCIAGTTTEEVGWGSVW